jgi:hypothetical protein
MSDAGADTMVSAALAATRESKRVEFIRAFSPAADGAWPELLKDVAAMANSGGGVIVIGAKNDGAPSGWDASELLALELDDVRDRFAPYVGERLRDFTVREAMKDGSRIAVLVVDARTAAPIVFERAGTYPDGNGGSKTAFERGTIYFRHGSRSAPASARDVATFVDREVARQRRRMASNVRKVVAAPKDAQVLVVPPKQAPSTMLGPVRVVDDPSAPAVARTDFDITHPYRQTEVVKTLNARFGERLVSMYDIQCVRRVYGVSQRDEFFHQPKFGSPQYSEAFVEWVLDEYEADPQFFEHAKALDRAQRLAQSS